MQRLLDTTPPGVVELLKIKGIGPQKVRALWRDAGIEGPEQLREAAEAGRVATLKGFGAKTQESILAALEFTDQSAGKLLFSQAEQLANDLRGAAAPGAGGRGGSRRWGGAPRPRNSGNRGAAGGRARPRARPCAPQRRARPARRRPPLGPLGLARHGRRDGGRGGRAGGG
ncbi:MAG: helix-hairpin-helix domain-containing protein [Hymenobacter sp.]